MKYTDSSSRTSIGLYPVIIFAAGGIAWFLYDSLHILVSSWLVDGRWGAWQFLIFPISIYMAVQKRPLQSEGKNNHYWLGVVCACFASLSYLIGKTFLIDFAIEIGFLFFIAQMTILWKGLPYFRSIIWPFGYLLLTTSIFTRLIEYILSALQITSAILTQVILSPIGFPVLRSENFLKLPSMVLEVASVCSGANQLTALLSFAIPLAYFKLNSNLLRAIVVFAVLPISVFFNSLRIALIAVWNYHQTQAYIHGPKDILLIPIIFPFAIILIFICTYLFKRFFEKDKSFRAQPPVFPPVSSRPSQVRRNILVIACLSSAPFIAVNIPALFAVDLPSSPVSCKQPAWLQVSGDNPIPVSYKYGKPDRIFSGIFINNKNDTLLFHQGFYRTQNNHRRVFGNSIDFRDKHQTGTGLDAGIKLNLTVLDSLGKERFSGKQIFVFYWYNLGGSPCSSPGEFRTGFFKRFLRGKGTSGSFIALGIPFSGSAEAAAVIAESFIKDCL